MKACREFLANDRFARVSGIELVDCRPGYAKTQVELTEQHLNGAGTAHGGLLFTLADFAFAAAVNAYGRLTLSISNSISYFARCGHGVLTAEAKEIARSEKLITCDINIADDQGNLLANFKGTAFITGKELPRSASEIHSREADHS